MKKIVKIFSSFEEENKEEYSRRRKMSVDDRIKEFSILQERLWGKDWRSKPIEKIATWEKLK